VKICTRLTAFFVALICITSIRADDVAGWTASLGKNYEIQPNIVYSTANGHENKLDLYLPRGEAQSKSGPRPTLIYIHGGGWVHGTKEHSVLNLLPYMKHGMAVVNVEYRLAATSLAPAAVADCRCALRWVIASARMYGFDTKKIVVTGNSAGGHLALTTSLLNESAGLDYECVTGSLAGPVKLDLNVAAVVNWYGITDVPDILTGPNQQGYAVRWMGSQVNSHEIAKRVSPLTHVRVGLPPVFTIHGDADKIVPYSHAVRLHEALEKIGVKNQLHTVKGGGHGGFSDEEQAAIYKKIDSFLRDHGIL
jgi:acetyl esterase/lipase